MQAQLETLGQLERRLTISVPRDDIARQVETRLKNLARTAKVDGFRPGKAPMNIVTKMYGLRVQEEVLGEMVEQSFGEAVEEQKLQVAGYPRFEPKEAAEETGDFQFMATFDVFPEVKIGDLATAEVERASLDVTDADVAKTLNILQRQRTKYERVERAAQNEDRVIINFVGTIDGVAFQGGSAENHAFLLGKNQMLPEFEAGVVGMKEGETRTVTVNFPADYHGKEVAGKTAQFEITVKNVAEPKLPEVDVEFAKSLGIPDGDLDKLNTEVRNNLEREVRNRIKARNKDNALNALIAISPVDLPKSMVEMEVGRLIEKAREDLKARGIDPKLVPISPQLFEEQAQRRVHLGFLLSEMVRANDLSAKAEQVSAMIDDLAQNYEQPEEVKAWYFSDQQRLASIENLVLEDNVVEFILSKAKAVDKAIPFDELMGQQG